MYRTTQDWRCYCSGFVLLSSVLIASFQDSVFAQISPDGTLPNNSNVTRDGNTFNITGGTTAGSNLFHSFEEFSVPTNGTASFNNAVDIQNIISRVTGGSVSDINGLIKANGTANLFLINPSGIVFGENAKLDIGGSFVGSTADAIGFGENNFFSASSPENSSSLLEVNPSALFFNQVKAASIQSNSVADSGRNLSDTDTARGLRVPDGKSLLLVGGDIDINGIGLLAFDGGFYAYSGGGLYAFGGRIELGGLASAGEVGLNENGNNLSLSFPEGVERSDVSLTNRASARVIAENDGSIAINARNLQITEGSFLIAGIEGELGSADSRTGDIDINATNVTIDSEGSIVNRVLPGADGQAGNVNIKTSTLRVENGAQVIANTLGRGKGGNLNVDAQDVRVIGGSEDSQFPSKLSTSVAEDSTGDAGDLTIKTNALLVKDGAQVSTGTFGEGKGGNLTVDAQDIQLIGESKDGQFPSGLFASAEKGSTGNAGDLTVKADTLLARNGAVVNVGTFGEGKGGNLTVNAQDIQLIGIGSNNQFGSGFFASADPNSIGDGGDLTIKTNTLLLQDGAQAGAGTFGKGKGGSLTVNAQDIQLIGVSKDGRVPSGLFASTQSNSKGNGGDLTVKTNTLILQGGAVVSTSTSGEGKGGNLTVDAQDIQLIGESKDGRFGSGLLASAQTGSIGDAGDLTVTTNILLLLNGAVVSVDTFGEGKGGKLTVNAEDIQLISTSKDGQFPSGLFASAQNSIGDAGDLTVTTDTLLLKDGAVMSTVTFGGSKGGNLAVNAKDVQLIGESKDGSPSILSASAQPNSKGDAGDLKIKTNSLLLQDGSVVSTSTSGKGKGGNLTVKTNTMLLKDGAQLSASTFGEGKGGDLTIIDAFDMQLIGRNKDGQNPSGLFASAQPNSTGNAGDLTVNTDILQLENGAGVAVESFTREGIAGELTINADSISLNNNALLSASTSSNKIDPEREQATININSQDLIMRQGSNIFTNARGENVVAGNIKIDTDFLIANENSDISADSANSQGGNVRIDAQGIFGTQFRLKFTPQSDITATGASSDLSGTVELNTPEVDPNSGLIELPAIPVDTEVAQGCYSPGYAQSSFIIGGDGGLPPNPKDVLTPDTTQIDWVSVKPSNNNRSLQPVTTKPTSAPKRIVEATGATLNAKGQIVLAANPSTVTSNNISKNNSISCQNKLKKEN